MTKASGPNRFVKHIDRLITDSSRTQRAIAEALGYEKPNIITMFKHGDTRVPLDKVPLLADALEVDRVELINMWLKEYEPAMLDVVQHNLGFMLSRSEKAWIVNMREIFNGAPPPWDERSEGALRPLTGAPHGA